MIKIVVDNILGEDLNKERKIKEIKALSYEQLPKAYLRKEASVYLKDGTLYIKLMGTFWRFIEEGEVYKESHFQNKLEVLRKAKKMLKEVNEKVNEIEKSWCGEDTFII